MSAKHGPLLIREPAGLVQYLQRDRYLADIVKQAQKPKRGKLRVRQADPQPQSNSHLLGSLNMLLSIRIHLFKSADERGHDLRMSRFRVQQLLDHEVISRDRECLKQCRGTLDITIHVSFFKHRADAKQHLALA